MSGRVDYRDIWPNNGHRKMCVNCRGREADVFFSVREAPQGVQRTHYLCSRCFYTGVVEVLIEHAPQVHIADIHIDLSTPDDPYQPLREEIERKERDWRN